MGSNTFQAKLLSVQRNLLNFAYSLTSNRDDAYDLLQDTTLKALDSEDKYVENINFKGWIFTIMRNLFINKYRKDARSVVVIDQSDDLYQLNFSQDSGLSTPEGAINAKDIHAVIDSFAEEYRRPFSLYIAGYRYAEIADKMGLPLGTVKSRIHQARIRLQALLKDMRYD
ncbi:MAG: sigma-70 family RNA polymerase sigma factor [Muribaculaceae bacterium]|nr:sigma-70 family RNA polymerase sigma factor [Muribaculaceae bacterium]